MGLRSCLSLLWGTRTACGHFCGRRSTRQPLCPTGSDVVVWKRRSGRVERFGGFRGLELSVSRFRSSGKSAWSETDPHPSCSGSAHTGQHHACFPFLALCAGTCTSTMNLNTPTSYKNALKSNVTPVRNQVFRRVLICCSTGRASL